ncbi:hypothetical protein KCM76_25335 [Zooshikella marina]|uniref:hypothetical protein n=1 Tax=Zooshikella ganghwensis TaxID=202772 RepID=UPI001BAFB731|nr:hypothetical protein [Zooshikella ganghwensis]MBU2709344.1 hypothetical protein [Zooshikella ganghwensis]
MDDVHKVAIVVDKGFSRESLLSIASNMHVWLIESETNLENTKFFYEHHNSSFDDLLADGVTVFQNIEGESPESILNSIIDEVDEHHNEYSRTPGWSELHVYGVPINERIKAILYEFGFLNFRGIGLNSFVATK